MVFTESQQIALALTPKFTAFLSIAGSFWIVIEVLTQKSKRHNVYNRLLCAMSCVDILMSIWLFASTWPIPEGSEGVKFAVGNERTCTAQGFFVQFGIVSPIYNCCLAVYYMLVVKFGVSEERLRYNIELPMHLFAVGFGSLTATSGLFLDLYSSANLWCWIAPYPVGCKDSHTYGETTCIRGDNAWIFRWAFFFGPLWFVIFLVTIIMAVVYRTVRRREMDAIGANSNDASGTVPSSPKRRSSVLVDGGGGNNAGSITAGRRRSPIMQNRAQLMMTTSSIVMPRRMADRMQSTQSVRGRREEEANRVLEMVETFTSANQQNVEANSFGSRVVYQQALYYTLAFYVAYTFATINRVIQQVTGENYFVIQLLHSMCIPMQGFLNALIYRYAFFVRLKQRNPHMKGWELVGLTWRWSFLGPPKQKQKQKQKKDSEQTQDMSDDDAPERTSKADLSKASNEVRSDDNDMMSLGRGIEDVDVLTDDILGGGLVGAATSSGVGTTTLQMNNMLVADMMMSYSDFPNMISEDAVMISTQYPRMIEEHSSSQEYPPGATTIHHIPQSSFPTFVNDFDDE